MVWTLDAIHGPNLDAVFAALLSVLQEVPLGSLADAEASVYARGPPFGEEALAEQVGEPQSLLYPWLIPLYNTYVCLVRRVRDQPSCVQSCGSMPSCT